MDRERILAFMAKRDLNNRKLATLLGIDEAKVSKSLTTNGKPRRWQGDEVLKLVTLMEGADPGLVKSEVRGTGMSAQDARSAWVAGGEKPVPLFGTAYGGDWEDLAGIEMTELHLSEVLDYLARPPSLAGDQEAYVVETVSDSMFPRFKPGERAFVSPRAPVRVGDDVVVQLVDPDALDDLASRVSMVLIKEVVKRTAAAVELRQFNPPRTFTVPIDRVAIDQRGKPAIHRVVGRL